MKKLSILALAAAGLLLGACSDKSVVDENIGGGQNSENGQFISFGINMPTTPVTRAIGNDQDQGSDINGVLDDGLVSEYAVNSAILVVFTPSTASGATENDATFHSAYNISPQPWTTSEDHQVTQKSRKIVQQVKSGVVKDNLIFVMLNASHLFTVDASNGLTLETGKFTKGVSEKTTAAPAITTSTTFSTFRNMLFAASTQDLKAENMTENGFFMCNAPLADKQGSTTTAINEAVKLQTLVAIKDVYKTQAEAEAAAADQIYVERGMAKVTLNGTITNAHLTGTGMYTGESSSPIYLYDIALDGWTLDNTNRYSFLVRSDVMKDESVTPIKTDRTDDTPIDISASPVKYWELVSTSPLLQGNLYRYIGKTEITEGSPSPYKYRPYWAQDPNYSTQAGPVDKNELNTIFGRVTGAAITDAVKTAALAKYTGGYGEKNPRYCYENTFDVLHQTQENTTLVRIAVKTTPTGGTNQNLFTLNGTKSTIYKQDAINTKVWNAALTVIKAQKMHAATYNLDATATYFETPTFTGHTNAQIAGIGMTSTGLAQMSTTDVYKFDTDGTTRLTGDENKLWDAANNKFTNAFYALVNTEFNKENGNLDFYENGISYYTVRIRHFGNELTPWNGNGSTTASDIENTSVTDGTTSGDLVPSLANGVYPGSTSSIPANIVNSAKNYLGRYGVLRNNWYDINISEIKYLGDAEPKEADDTTDDELDAYINVQINVLSWAKRTQTWSF